MRKKSLTLLISSCTIALLLCIAAYLSVKSRHKDEAPKMSQRQELTGAKTTPEERGKPSVIPADKADKRQGEEKTERQDQEAALVDSGPQAEGVDVISRALNNPNVGARVQAVLSLRGQHSLEAIRLLSKFLQDKDDAVVSEAIDTLGYIGLNSDLKENVYALLEERARNKEFPRRGQALITAAMMGMDARILPIISDYISEKDDLGKGFAVRAMSFIASPECVPYLSVVLDECEDPTVQRNAFIVLSKINTWEAVDLLERYAVSSNEREQVVSTWALSRHNSEDYNRILIDAMADGQLRDEAIAVVASSPAAPSVFSEILQREEIKKEDKIEYLERLAENTLRAPPAVREEVFTAVLSPMLSAETDTELLAEAIETAGKVAAGEDKSEDLAPFLTSDSFLVREAALEAYIQYATPRNYKELKKLWWDDDEKIRRTAFFFSEQFLNDQEDRQDLEKAMHHPKDDFIRKHAKIMLEQVLRSH